MEMGFKHQPIRSIGFLFGLASRMHPTSSGLWQLRWNSNPHFTDFESAPSADWGTEPYLSQADFLPHSYFQHRLVNDVYIISLYHLCRYVFALMLTEHAQARPQFSISYLPLLKLCADPLHRRDIDLTVIFKSGRILYCFVNPNPFHYAEQIDRCALLGITVFRTTATRFHAYLIYLTHVP